MRNSERFAVEVAARSKVENAWTCTQEYLVLIPENEPISDYQYSAIIAQAGSNQRSSTIPRQSSNCEDPTIPTVLPRSLPSAPFSEGHQHMIGHLTSSRVQIRQLDTDDDEGYVAVRPQPPKSPKPLPSPPKSPLKSSPNRSVPTLQNVPSGAKPLPLKPKPTSSTKPLPKLKPMSLKQTSPEPLSPNGHSVSVSSFERSNSESNEYYNIHFRPATKKKLTNQLSASTPPTHNRSSHPTSFPVTTH